MDQIKIRLEYKDAAYNRALERAILLRTDKFVLSDHEPDIILNESLIPLFLPASLITEKIMALQNCPKTPVKPLEDAVFTAFCSATGGSGLSTVSVCYAKLVSRLFGKKTAFISFDPWYRQEWPDSDEYGLRYISSIKDASDIDELVLDIPFGAENYTDILDMCDRRVVVMGFDEKRHIAGEKFFNALVISSSQYINPPTNYQFFNSFDRNINTSDVHSALGKEVMKLAEELQKQQTCSQYQQTR